jgi:hypothetical protein
MSQTTDRRPSTVNRSLTLNGSDPSTSTKGPQRRRRRSEVENDDFARFAVRIIRAHGRRIGEGDVEGLAEELNAAMRPSSQARPGRQPASGAPSHVTFGDVRVEAAQHPPFGISCGSPVWPQQSAALRSS